MKEDTSEEHMSCQRLTSSHYPIREQQCQCPTPSCYPQREQHVGGAQNTLGTRRRKQRAKFRFTHTLTHTEADSNRSPSDSGLFSETLECSSSRRGMPTVNTAARRRRGGGG